MERTHVLKTGPAAGIFWMCMATLLSSVAGGMVRALSGEIPTIELVFFRNVVAIAILAVLASRPHSRMRHGSRDDE